MPFFLKQKCLICNKKITIKNKQIEINGFNQAGLCPKCEIKLCEEIDSGSKIYSGVKI